MTVRVFVAWYDLWIGVYVDKARRRVYICLLPCVVVRIGWGKEADHVRTD